MTEWREIPLGNLGKVTTGGTPPARHPEWFGAQTPFITPTDISGGDRRARPQRWLSPDGCIGLQKKVIPAGSVAFVCIGATIGKLCLTEGEAVTNQQINSIVPGKDIDGRFVYYLLRHEAVRIASMAGGAATPILNKTAFSSVRVRVPGSRTQVTIGSILGTMDDLIENNRRRVEALEEMARSIYREWFVHMRFPGHEDVTFIDSRIGPVPDEWHPTTISALSAVVTRGIAPKYADNGTWVVINQKCIRDERIALGPARRQERAVPALKRVRYGDVLINSTGIGTLGRAAVCRLDLDNLTVDSHVTIARPIDTSLNPWYGLTLTSMKADFESLGTGSTGQTELSRADIGSITVVSPPLSLRLAFGGRVCPLLGEAELLLRSIHALAEIRDALLPKLVTGQLDVSKLDLDALVKDAVA